MLERFLEDDVVEINADAKITGITPAEFNLNGI